MSVQEEVPVVANGVEIEIETEIVSPLAVWRVVVVVAVQRFVGV